MNYALFENGLVTNIIWLYPANASDFPNAVPMGDYPVGIGDIWDGENFYRGKDKLLTYTEQAALERQDMLDALSLLGVSNEVSE